MANKITKNVIANTIGKLWTALASIAFVPIYISLLGEEAYGVVTFFAVMQSVLNIMGVGLQKTLRREFANTNEVDVFAQNERKYKLLRSAELIYFVICGVIIFICTTGSSFIANQWLNYETLLPSDVSLTISLMGTSIGFQLVANLYLGCIFGLDYQGEANLLQVIWTSLKHVGVIAVLAIVSKSIIGFYTWNVIIDIIYCIVLRLFVRNHIPIRQTCIWKLKDISNLSSVWKYAAGLFLISVGSIFNTQIDKIVMSRYLPVVDCGAYNSTYHLASFASYVPTIIGTAIFSNIAGLIFKGERDEANKIFSSANKKAVIIVSALSAYIAVFSYELLFLWTGQVYADIMKTAAPLVIIGFALNAFQQVPYDYLLASGNTKINQIQVYCCIPYVLVITVHMTKNYGVFGASLAWIIEMILSTIIYLFFFYKFSFGKGAIKWIVRDVLSVFSVSLVCALIIKTLTKLLKLSIISSVIFAVFFGGVTLCFLFYIYDRGFLRTILGKVTKKAQ